MKTRITILMLIVIAIPGITIARTSMNLRIGSYGRGGSRNFSLRYYSHGRRSFRGSYSIYGYRYQPSYRSVYYQSIYSRPICYQPIVPIIVSRPIVTTPVIVQQPVVIQNDRFRQNTRNRMERFLQMLGEKKEARIEAIKNLIGFSYNKRVETALIEILLHDEDPELRWQVAHSLGKINNKAFIVALEMAKEDPNDAVAQEALASLTKLR